MLCVKIHWNHVHLSVCFGVENVLYFWLYALIFLNLTKTLNANKKAATKKKEGVYAHIHWLYKKNIPTKIANSTPTISIVPLSVNWKEESHISRIRWALKVFYTEWMKWDEKERHRKRQRRRQRKRQRKKAHKTIMKQATSILAVRMKQQLLSYHDHWPIVLFSFDLKHFSFQYLPLSHIRIQFVIIWCRIWIDNVFVCALWMRMFNSMVLIFKTVCNLSIDYNFMKESTRLLYEVIVGVRLVESFSWI